MVMPHTVIPTFVMFSFWLITKIKICIETIILFITYVKYEIGLQHTHDEHFVSVWLYNAQFSLTSLSNPYYLKL